jgi:hypothetical protein
MPIRPATEMANAMQMGSVCVPPALWHPIATTVRSISMDKRVKHFATPIQLATAMENVQTAGCAGVIPDLKETIVTEE